MKPLPKSLQDNPRLGAWLGLEQDGRVTLHSGKVELGQGIHTALIQIAAEELNLAPDCFDLEAVSTSNGPDEWLTASSQSIESGGTAIRAAAACLRDAVIGIAASMLNADPAHLHLAQGRVLHGDITTGHSLWSLADRIDWEQDLRGGWTAKPWDSYQWVGKPVPRRDLPAILSGGSFLQDLKLPDMLHGRVLHPPVHGAVLEEVPTVAFQERFGEQCRLLRQRNFLAIVAESESLARQAADYLGARLRWRQPEVSIPGEVAPWLQAQPGQVMRDDPVPAEIGATRYTATYSRGFLLHASIAPSCAVAWRDGGKLHIWTHSQGVFPLRNQLVRALGLPAAEIVLEHRPSAGCYGHNGADDVALEAALLAEVFPGRPIRVLWSRADEMTATCGSAMAISLASGLDASGKIGAWQAEVWSGTHSSRPGAGGDVNLTAAAACDPAFAPKTISDVADAVGGGAMRNVAPLYDLPSVSVRHHLLTSLPLRTSSLRALGAQPNVFAIEGFMDELAELAGCDPLEFRRRHLNDPRGIAVLDRVAAMAGWKTDTETSTGTGRAKGIGFARYKNKSAYCAVVVEVEVEEVVRVTRVWCAVDAGFVINPDGARNQVEGGIVQSLSWCLKEAVRSTDGMVSSRDWDSYPILRFSEVPEIETSFIVDREAEALGVGETSQGPTAAALGNAVSRALGIRLRDLPFTRDRLLAALA